MDTEPRATSESVAVPETGAAPLVDGTAFPERGVYRRLLQDGHRFGFFQAVRLLEQLFAGAPAPGETSDVRNERIRFRPSTALVFPPTDLKRIERRAEKGADVIVTFMGLYGIDSPLPYYFYDDLATEDERTFAHRDFLDIFNHRLYAFFYRAWKKYRPGLYAEADGRNAPSGRFLSLAGLGTPRAMDRAPVPPMQLAALAGWFGPRTRNAEGLEAVLRMLFDGIPVGVVENVPRWVPVRTRPALGQGGGARLGQRATVGERVYDRSGKFRIRLGPMAVDDYLALLPGGAEARRLRRVVRMYAPDYLDFDVELQVHAADLPRARLGDRTAQLGLTTCLGRSRDAVLQRVVDYEA